MSTTFSFREYDVPDPLRVELSEDDAPHGRPYESAGFSSGGPVRKKKVELPGRREPLYHGFKASDRPLVVSGSLRDVRMGQGHAKALRALIERVRERFNLLRITWDAEQWTGVLDETEFGHEGPGHLTYALTFDIALPPGTVGPTPAPRRRGTSDALDRVLLQLRARPVPPTDVGGLLDTLARGMAAVEDGLGAMGDAVRDLEARRDNLARQVRRVTTLGAQVQQQAQAVERVVRATTAEAAGAVGRVQDTVAWARWCYDRNEELREVRGSARAAMEEARVRERATERLYRVRPGDTPESIAQEQLGDASRAGDLGLTPADLTPGRVLRLPAPAPVG